MTDNEKNDADRPVELQRFDAQIKHVRKIVGAWGDEVRMYHTPFTDDEGRRAFMKRVGLGPRRGGRASVVPAEDCAVELGAPGKSNANMVLWTFDDSIIDDGAIRLMGPDMKGDVKSSLPYAQVVLLSMDENIEADPFAIESTQYLSNRLQGFMVRTVPGRLWARISREAIAAGMDFARLGAALVAAYKDDFPAVRCVEVVFVTSSDADVDKFTPIVAESKIVLGKNKKLVLVGAGEYECTDLDCDDCDEKETCDEVRDIVILRRKRKQTGEG